VTLVGGALLVGSVVLSALGLFAITMWTAVAILLLALTPGYLRAHYAIRSVKIRDDWFAGQPEEEKGADVTLSDEPGRFPWLWAIPSLLVLAMTVALGTARYPLMPETLVMHYNARGIPDRTAVKSVSSAFSLVFVQAAVTALILAVARLSWRARPDLDPAAPTASSHQHRVFLIRMARTTLVLAACVNLSMLAVSWQMWTASFGDGTSIALALLPIVAGLFVVGIVSARTGQTGSRVPVSRREGNTGAFRTDDDQSWRAGGILYINQRDPALLVPKRFGVGWTLNFGNPRALILPPAVIMIILAALALSH
jgi:uncharacterized membrane protein